MNRFKMSQQRLEFKELWQHVDLTLAEFHFNKQKSKRKEKKFKKISEKLLLLLQSNEEISVSGVDMMLNVS